MASGAVIRLETVESAASPPTLREDGFAVVRVDKTSDGLGFSIVGGSDDNHIPGDSSIFVSRVKPGGPAEAHLQEGIRDQSRANGLLLERRPDRLRQRSTSRGHDPRRGGRHPPGTPMKGPTIRVDFHLLPLPSAIPFSPRASMHKEAAADGLLSYVTSCTRSFARALHVSSMRRGPTSPFPRLVKQLAPMDFAPSGRRHTCDVSAARPALSLSPVPPCGMPSAFLASCYFSCLRNRCFDCLTTRLQRPSDYKPTGSSSTKVSSTPTPCDSPKSAPRSILKKGGSPMATTMTVTTTDGSSRYSAAHITGDFSSETAVKEIFKNNLNNSALENFASSSSTFSERDSLYNGGFIHKHEEPDDEDNMSMSTASVAPSTTSYYEEVRRVPAESSGIIDASNPSLFIEGLVVFLGIAAIGATAFGTYRYFSRR
uniref:PDZ domain-containing protein n=1 Tax=Steinernema glaseri TaxID=37863 RepID=A0A1I8AR09_9BILA